MWYREAAGYKDETPKHELLNFQSVASNAIKLLLFKQKNYYPSDLEVEKKTNKLLNYMDEKYGKLTNTRLYTHSQGLKKIVSDNVEELYVKKKK